MNFVEVVNNLRFTEKGIKPAEDVTREIIPVGCLQKIYKHIAEPADYIIAYQYRCPVTGFQRTFYEKLPPAIFVRKWEALLEALTGFAIECNSFNREGE